MIDVTLPEGSLLNPRFPAPLSNRLNVHTRFFDCQSGALGQRAPDLSMAAGYGTSPVFVFSGTDPQGRYFQFVESYPLTGSGKVQKFVLRENAIKALDLQEAAKIKTA